MPKNYQPPFSITPQILKLASEISEAVGRLSALVEPLSSLRLRRASPIRNTDQVSDQVSDQVERLLRALSKQPLTNQALMLELVLSHRPSFRNNYLNPALDAGLIERTQPDSPRSPTQKYRLTAKGREWLFINTRT